MGNIFDPGGLFPLNDGVEPITTTNTPVGYDLTQLLSESMRARPPWMSFAQVASQVLYKYVEKTRLGLELSRDPHHIERALKIATLKMLGFDWNSDVVTDDAYDRLIESVSLYLQNHGPGDFINYMGYALGFSTQMITLWTRDYKGFFPGPQKPNILQYAPGDQIPDDTTIWYPTSHVGVLYELYASNAPNADQIEQIRDIFYRIAPIHLVLEFIGAMITGSVGTLYFCVESFYRGEFTAIAEYIPKLVLYFAINTYTLETQTGYCEPLHPNRKILGNFGTYGVETGLDRAVAQSIATAWSEGYQPLNPDVTYVGSYDVPGTFKGQMFWSLQPNDAWAFYDSSIRGLLVQKTITLLLSSSSNPLTSNWIAYGVDIEPNFLRLDDKNLGYSIESVYKGGCVSSGGIPFGTDCVVFTFRAISTDDITITRGSNYVSYNPHTKTISVSGVSNYGIYPIGSDFYVLWGVMSGSLVSVYPGGMNGQGSVDWFDFQVIQGAHFPCPLPPTSPTDNAVAFAPQTFNQFNSVIAQLLYQYNVTLGFVNDFVEYAVDLGSVSDPNILNYMDAGLADIEIADQLISSADLDMGFVTGGQFDYIGYTDTVVVRSSDFGSVLQAVNKAIDLGILGKTSILPPNVFYFYNGIAELGYGYTPLTTSEPTTFVGTIISANSANFTKSYGMALLDFCPIFPEWHSATMDILNVVDILGGLQIRITNTNIVAIFHGTSFNFSLIDGFIRIGLLWSPTTLTVYVNGNSHTFNSGFSLIEFFSLFSNENTTSEITCLLKNLLIMGADTAIEIPDDLYMRRYTGSLMNVFQHTTADSLGNVNASTVLFEDAGFTNSSVIDTIDFGTIP